MEIIKIVKFMTVVFPTSIKAVLRISFYQDVMYAHIWILVKIYRRTSFQFGKKKGDSLVVKEVRGC